MGKNDGLNDSTNATSIYFMFRAAANKNNVEHVEQIIVGLGGVDKISST